MNIHAGNLQARNIGQLVQIDKDGDTLMGKLERIKLFRNKDGVPHTVTMRVSGETWQGAATDEIRIWRSPELAAMVRLGFNQEELAEALLEDVGDAPDPEQPTVTGMTLSGAAA